MSDELPKILAVDDNPKNLRVLAALLASNQYMVDYAFRGMDAIKFASEQEYDLILMDVMMPEMDGYEACTKIKQADLNKEAPVIFLTAKNDLESLKRGFASGGIDYVTKPFNGEELMTRVNTHIELKQLRDRQKEINRWLEEKVRERTRELNEANITLEKANRELQTLDTAKTDFLRLINHEIRTPLNALNGYIQILKNEHFPEDIREMLTFLDRASSRLEKFLMVVLQITELLTNDRPLQKEPVPIRELIDTSIKNNMELIENKKHIVKIISDKFGIMINGNRKLLQHCFDSLLENAIEFSEVGSLIILRYTIHDSGIEYEVIDEGSGFSEMAINNLYKFFAPGGQHVDQNAGLALALAKMTMDAHQGTIQAANNPGKGATVKLNFIL
ncbi:MAG: hybrid sensor histidine kinase/response regulator [Bacteroidales bacterium]|jgi:two-component system sensor histidine kinase/response regulator|nr:hybrid sensor histidine kinase/response regulator [Bacteroidales bacterium]